MSLSRGKCNRTHKVRYPDLLAAKMALATIRKHDSTREDIPVRAYQCEFCKGAHLTSQAMNRDIASVKSA